MTRRSTTDDQHHVVAVRASALGFVLGSCCWSRTADRRARSRFRRSTGRRSMSPVSCATPWHRHPGRTEGSLPEAQQSRRRSTTVATPIAPTVDHVATARRRDASTTSLPRSRCRQVDLNQIVRTVDRHRHARRADRRPIAAPVDPRRRASHAVRRASISVDRPRPATVARTSPASRCRRSRVPSFTSAAPHSLARDPGSPPLGSAGRRDRMHGPDGRAVPADRRSRVARDRADLPGCTSRATRGRRPRPRRHRACRRRAFAPSRSHRPGPANAPAAPPRRADAGAVDERGPVTDRTARRRSLLNFAILSRPSRSRTRSRGASGGTSACPDRSSSPS